MRIDITEMDLKSHKMFEELTTQVNRQELVADNLKAKMHENTVELNEELSKVLLRLERARTDAKALKARVDLLQDSLQVANVIGAENCQYKTIGDFVTSIYDFHSNAPTMITSLASELI